MIIPHEINNEFTIDRQLLIDRKLNHTDFCHMMFFLKHLLQQQTNLLSCILVCLPVQYFHDFPNVDFQVLVPFDKQDIIK